MTAGKAFVIQLIGPAGLAIRTPHDGRYLVECDVDGVEQGNLIGLIVSTDQLEEAKLFPSVADALLYWKRQSTTIPLRPDGRPNRPLTAYTVEVEPVTIEEGGRA